MQAADLAGRSIFLGAPGYGEPALGRIGEILQRVGYVANEIVQSPETIEGIRKMFSIYPGLIMLPAPLIFIWFPITRKKAMEIREQLNARSMGRKTTSRQ